MNRLVKKVGVVLGVAGLSLTLAACSNDKTVVSYKGGKITQSEFYDELKKSSSGQSTLANMIIEKSLDEQYGDKVSSKKVTKEFNNYKKQYGSQFDSVLTQNGLTQATFKKNIRTNMLTEVALKDLKKVTAKQEQKAWKSFEPKVTVQHILVEKEDTAKTIIAELDKGTSFKSLAKKYSTDDATKEDAGKLPAFDNSDTTLDSTFKEAAFKLKQGEYTKTAVKTEYGYHVIKMIKRPAKGTLKERKAEIDKQIYDSWLQDSTVMQGVIAKVLKKADPNIKDSDLKSVLSQYATSTTSSSVSK
ncbi:peptidylprolyl isomerase [Amylolactobacillus amylotrophicus DSM 20534]|uniref:Foldase protein PrsA n=3 Tax=Amylolactobacillus TaxID=2767876 RepID=A0A0R1YHK3_9LACO|nr:MULTISPECIES: peptidylprolyl isomerase PrsA [Amylolactobacillus]APT18007.1 peptidylprolyl isomerase [Amylolactobacillus amylophilus DSM 20533 = JCM 1125]KRK37291.1 peptidylprolyl isomerase [Amylolactobacillus amylotrophicus DSM 20534]KRM41690.1 peptidylprolyl isomerase [Amylolactobacillus amylophilus DSM 20533 = JCM 1125]GED80712.1 foldase protein PrsA [Amylolactobacillus amylophilus]